MKRILVVGGAGYVGSNLVPKLLKKGYFVKVFDTFWFWNSPEDYLDSIGGKNNNLELVVGDIRNYNLIRSSCENIDDVIMLACISNDPSADLDSNFTHSINYGGCINTIDAAKESKVKRFVYASSSSVYGIKEEPNVTEDMSLEPLTQYSKLKVEIEHYLKYRIDNNFKGIIIRPSTVCGYSPRLRLDVVVNILANYAINKGKIKVFGGDQLRPNINIEDMSDLYLHILNLSDDKFDGSAYNGGYQNMKVIEIADLVKKVVGQEVSIEIVPTDDNRSYHVSSEKIKSELQFSPKYSVEDAILSLKTAFAEKKVTDIDNDCYYNVKRIKNFIEKGLI